MDPAQGRRFFGGVALVPVGHKRTLNRLLKTYDFAAHRERDPVTFVHRFQRPEDQEIVALISSSLAFGNVRAVRNSIERVLSALNPNPAVPVSKRVLDRRLRDFRHRVYTGADVTALLHRAFALCASQKSLGAVFEDHLSSTDELREALARLSDQLRGPAPSRGLAHLIPDPKKGSACKRLLLFLRWMVRPKDGVDLGLWTGVRPSKLIIPVDTHIHRIARNLGFTSRATADWKTAEEITARLREFDPKDPVKYDFALCHLGISRACPSRRDPDKCSECRIRPICKQWRPT